MIEDIKGEIILIINKAQLAIDDSEKATKEGRIDQDMRDANQIYNSGHVDACQAILELLEEQL